jgi:hypothetical protein
MQQPGLGGQLSPRAFVGSLAGLGVSAAGLAVMGGCSLVSGAAAKHARIGVLTGGTAASAPEW